MTRRPRPLRRLADGLASYRQAIDSTVWIDFRIDRCLHCGRKGIDGCDPATPAHPAPATPGPLRRTLHTLRVAWLLRRPFPKHLRRPFGNTLTHTDPDAPF
ncbi:hypothetical protein ACIHJG_34235 [Streptomyces sp. NPDC052415]|uniref:hypothetical protein n=1 Tax=Streptomyces sp. NPDC052415 TaxID=3365690 RepID=UPI0037D7DF67